MESKMVTKWLNEVLTNKNYKVLGYEFPDIEFKGGYIAKMINVKISVEKEGVHETLDVIVKSSLNSSDDTFKEAHLNEVNFYTEIVPHYHKFAEEHGTEKFENIPHCYGISTTDHHIVSILENLNPKGFKVRDFEPLDLAHLKLLFEAFAKWHAFSFALRDQKPDIFDKLGKRNIKLDDWKIVDFTVLSFEQQIDYIIGIYEKINNKSEVLNKLISLRKNYRNLMREFLENIDEDYLVLTHADAWNNNFLFKYNTESIPTEVRIVDWQTAVIGSPLIDISQLFFFCCFREELDHMDDLLGIYYTNLSEKIRMLGSDPEKCFPHQAFRKSFKRYALLGIAGMPFLLRMYYNDKSLTDGYNLAETSENGNFSAILGNGFNDFEMFFKKLDAILEFCIERDLF